MSMQRARLTSAATLLAAMALASTSLPALAQDSGDINVTGTSLETMEDFTIDNFTAAFGSDLAPDGTGGLVPSFTDTTGACYFWDGTNNVEVRSNIDYDLTVDVNATSGDDVSQLTLGATNVDFAGCTAGEQAVSPMFSTATPVGLWQSDTATAQDVYSSNLGLAVLWADGPAAYDTVLTLTAQAQGVVVPIRSIVSASALAAVVATLVAVGPVSAETRLAVVPAVLDVAGPLGGTGAVESPDRGTDETTLASSVEELSTATGLPLATTWSVVRPRKLELEPGEAGTFHLDLDIPNQTDPGGHYTAVSIATTAAKEDGAQAGVSGRIVVPVLITVTGDALRPTPPALPVVDRRRGLPPDRRRVRHPHDRNDGQTHVALAGDIDIARVAANGARQPMMSSAVSIGRVCPAGPRLRRQ